MREIKFRTWHNEAKDMVYFEIGENHFSAFDLDGQKWTIDDVRDYPIMQYTGLKDKNGKEIYEGDIVEIENEGQVISVCEKRPGYFTLIDRAGGEWTRQLFHQQERLFVIGNIHENPELLNSEEL